MATLHISPLAQSDLLEIRRYISEELQTARQPVGRILKSFRQLEQLPFSGPPLQANGADTGYRSIVSGNYRAFYHGNANDVYIVRILYGKRDFMRILFGSSSWTEEEEPLND